MATQLAARGPLATSVTKMLINAAEGEEVERPLEALAGLAWQAAPNCSKASRPSARSGSPTSNKYVVFSC